MEEILYTIQVYKDDKTFIGKTFSQIEDEKNFENESVGCLLRDIINDIQLNLDFSDYSMTE